MKQSPKQILARERNWQSGRMAGIRSQLSGMINGVYCKVTMVEQVKLNKARALIAEVMEAHSDSNIELGLKK